MRKEHNIPDAFRRACRRLGVLPTRYALVVSVARQQVDLFELDRQFSLLARRPEYLFRRRYRASTSRFGIGQLKDTNKTPLGLHRVAEKIGGGRPVGTVFRSRQAVGLTWDGEPDAPIAHRILWLDGMEPGFNRGGEVDTHARYVYIHGVGDETTLGRPASCGCVHLAAINLMPLFDRLPSGTLVWIER